MEPIHALEFELTSELTTDVQRSLIRLGSRHAWRHDAWLLLGWLLFAGLLAWPVLTGWWSPGAAGLVLFLVTLYVLGSFYRRRWQAVATAAAAVSGFAIGDRQVRLEFHAQRVLMQTEFIRGEGAWTELDQVAVFARFWILGFANGGRVVIPTASMTPELQAFLEAKAKEHAVEIVPA